MLLTMEIKERRAAAQYQDGLVGYQHMVLKRLLIFPVSSASHLSQGQPFSEAVLKEGLW